MNQQDREKGGVGSWGREGDGGGFGSEDVKLVGPVNGSPRNPHSLQDLPDCPNDNIDKDEMLLHEILEGRGSQHDADANPTNQTLLNSLQQQNHTGFMDHQNEMSIDVLLPKESEFVRNDAISSDRQESHPQQVSTLF